MRQLHHTLQHSWNPGNNNKYSNNIIITLYQLTILGRNLSESEISVPFPSCMSCDMCSGEINTMIISLNMMTSSFLDFNKNEECLI